MTNDGLKQTVVAKPDRLSQIAQLPQATRDRIAHIDFTLLFKGEAVRADLVDRFSIAAAQATKDFTMYRELAPGNIEYDQKLKLHKRGEAFEPLFDYDVVRTLATISQGYGDGFTGKVKPPLACEAPYHLNKPSLSIVAKVTEAIHKGKALSITYVSLSSGETTREIVPHTLVDNGLRWHVRGFDRKHGEFRDFVLTRIKAAVVLEDFTLSEAELEAQDRQWNRFVELELVPHPRIEHSEAIELDYGMTEGVMKVEIRAATAGYLLRLWNVDCSETACLSTSQCQLALNNRAALYGVQNLAIAPGYVT
ncbi:MULTISPECIES: WYL domain-containing protein [Gammaproteobacteria]|uniref:WYL domain-containing protein n=2 Tax=Salmonella enterica TaxID=28901 RepID=A0A723C8R8_SALER|nr:MULTISPECIES: WYL domain-containing protein [Gammaproteobacteria]RFT59355.1 WYL domain-containing protein [Salmonella enterica subsp. enterica serovar Senftenberg]HAD8714406.1 WYL domain-containing protein [Salmonella enterica]MDW1936346.1 WYL domain-containing protein [Vibrio sp. 818]QNN38198.1 WYL domain-containing protein [Salmonella enterica subsp. enterica serovar Albany]QOE48056.1 WYL domain-containing protein [Salmonella enterica subsp. enterica serovar Albany]